MCVGGIFILFSLEVTGVVAADRRPQLLDQNADHIDEDDEVHLRETNDGQNDLGFLTGTCAQEASLVPLINVWVRLQINGTNGTAEINGECLQDEHNSSSCFSLSTLCKLQNKIKLCMGLQR